MFSLTGWGAFIGTHATAAPSTRSISPLFLGFSCATKDEQESLWFTVINLWLSILLCFLRDYDQNFWQKNVWFISIMAQYTNWIPPDFTLPKISPRSTGRAQHGTSATMISPLGDGRSIKTIGHRLASRLSREARMLRWSRMWEGLGERAGANEAIPESDGQPRWDESPVKWYDNWLPGKMVWEFIWMWDECPASSVNNWDQKLNISRRCF